MGRKMRFKEAAKLCMDYVNKDNQNSIWIFSPKNLPSPEKVFAAAFNDIVKGKAAAAAPKNKKRRGAVKRRHWKLRKWKKTKTAKF